MSTPAHAFLPAEARLVFLTACGDWADAPIAETVATRVDWDFVLAFATREQASAATADRVARLGVAREGRDALVVLRRQGVVEQFRMTLLEERLDGLIDRFEEAGIDFVLLKGAAIALRYFGSLTARPMGDLDVLVRPDRAAEAHRLARELGWAPRSGLREEMYVGMPHLLPLVAADGLGFGLEIHTGIFPDYAPFRFSVDDVWQRAVCLPRPGSPMVPAPEHLLLHACLHFAWSHGFRRGAWRTVRDLEALLADPKLPSDDFGRLAEEARGGTCAYWTFAFLEEATGRTPRFVPRHVPRISTSLVHGAVLRHLFVQAVDAPETPGTRRLRRFLWLLAVRPRASGHGSARPWKAEERWAEPGTSGPSTEGLGDRLSGFVRYAGRVLGLGS